MAISTTNPTPVPIPAFVPVESSSEGGPDEAVLVLPAVLTAITANAVLTTMDTFPMALTVTPVVATVTVVTRAGYHEG